MEEKKRMQGYEQEALWLLFASVEGVKQHALDERIKAIPGGARDMGCIRAKIEKLLRGIVDSVPTDQLMQIQKNLRCVQMDIGLRKPAQKPDDEYGRWMSRGALVALMETAEEHCMLCDKTYDQQCKCGLKKALLELPCDITEGESKACPFSRASIWREGK